MGGLWKRVYPFHAPLLGYMEVFMKKKLIILTLCFTIIISSINFRKVDALVDGGVISLPMLATVVTLAVGTGIAIKNNDDIYDLGRMFYDYVHSNNELTWDVVKLAFESCKISSSGALRVDKSFSEIVKGFFDTKFDSGLEYCPNIALGLPVMQSISYSKMQPLTFVNNVAIAGNFKLVKISGNKVEIYLNGSLVRTTPHTISTLTDLRIGLDGLGSSYFNLVIIGLSGSYTNDFARAFNIGSFSDYGVIDFPYSGGYNPEGVLDKDKDGFIYVPGNLGDLVGGTLNPGDVLENPPYELPKDGVVSSPGVSNPSIELDGTTTFPLDDTVTDTPTDTPTDTVWDNIKAFIISLVVPADTFWTDTFGGLRGSFESAFPMVDMSNFNSLVVGGKPFPNIYVTVFGAKCKVVNGDVINSIAEWLRPLIAGFMMLCLMLYNYRKIYKLIRNTEPFGSIATGTSEFRTGMSAPSMSEGFSNLDIARDQLRDVAFDMRNDILSRKNKDI